MPFKKIKNQPYTPFSLANFIDETDYDYGKSSEATYLIGSPHNALSPYELKNILDNSESLTILSISTEIELPSDNEEQTIDDVNKAHIQVICLVSDDMPNPDEKDQQPNCIPIAILRNKDYEQINEMTGPSLDIAKNIAMTYANVLTMQGYEINWMTNTPTVVTGLAMDIAANQPVSISFTTNTKFERTTFQAFNRIPFKPGKMFTNNEEHKDHIFIFPHREISSDGIMEPIARYEEAMAFFVMASDAPELFHSDPNTQRLYHARMTQAALCVAQGCISLAHFADYVFKMKYEQMDIKDYDLHRACNPAELLLKKEPTKDPSYNPFHLEVSIPDHSKNNIHGHLHSYQKQGLEYINKNGRSYTKENLKSITKAAKDYNKNKKTNKALMDLGVDFATSKEEAKRDAIALYESGEPGIYNAITRQHIDEHGRVMTDKQLHENRVQMITEYDRLTPNKRTSEDRNC